MEKKASIPSFVVFLLLGLVILLVAGPMISKITNRSMDLTDDHIIQKLNDQTDREKALEDKIDGFPPVKLSGSISEESIDFGEDFITFLFEPTDGYNGTQGFLMSYSAPPILEDRNWEMILRSYSKGLAVLYSDGVKLETLASPSSDLYYLAYSKICVVPTEDKGLDAAKLMSYATGIKHEDLLSIPTEEEIDKIISDNRVDQLAFSIGGRSPTMKYFKGNDYFVSKHVFDDGKIVAFYKEGNVCFFPTDSTVMKALWKTHINFNTKNGQDSLIGDGFLHTSFSESMLAKITNSNKIKR